MADKDENLAYKHIVLIPNQPPVFVGDWTIGEIGQMAHGLLVWLDSQHIAREAEEDDNV